MQIPQMTPWLGPEESAAATEAITSSWISEGPRAESFVEKLNLLTGSPYGVLAPNGTLALALGLMALEVGPGDEVIVPDVTFIASATAVQLVGAKPVFVDVTPDTFQIDSDECKAALTKRTRAVMPVHLYGQAADMDSVMAFATEHDLLVIEDAAQAVGVTWNGRHAGSFGDVGCFSFFADKTITTGEGGYVACRSEQVYNRLRHLRNQGRPERGTFQHPAIGYNFRMTDIQASIGLVQLKRLPEIIERKHTILGWYQSELADVGNVTFLSVRNETSHVPFRIVLLHERAHELMDHLSQRGIQSRSFFYPLHKQPCFNHACNDAAFPNAMRGYQHGLCLPVFPTLTIEQVAYICKEIRSFESV